MAELRYTYLLDVKDRASRQVQAANDRIAKSVTVANRAMEKQGAVAASASRRVQTAGARQSAEWKQVARAAQTAERTVAQAATQASTKVSRALDRQIAAQRKAGASYAQIAREQRAAGASAAQTAAAIERSAAREQKAMAGRQRAAKGLSGIASSFKGFAGIALAAGGVSVLTKALSDSVAEGTEAVKAHAQTVAALKSTGGAANVTAKQIESLSTAISNQVGIDDEAIQSAENLLLTFTRVRNETGKGNDVFNRATRTIVDMSVALKTPLKNASILVGKALQDPIRGLTSLRRVGVSFTDQQRKQIATMVQSGRSMEAQKLILRELNREFGGSARAAATPMQKLGVVIKNLEETMGRALLPVINRAATALSKFFVQMQTGRGAGGQFAKTVSQIWTATKGVASALAPAAKAMATAFGPAARVARTAIGGMLQTIRGITGVVKGVVSVATHLIRGDFAGAWRAVKGIVRSALSGLGGLVKTLMAPVYTFASSAVRRALSAIGRLGSGVIGALRGAVGGVAKAAGAVGGAVLNSFRTLARLVAGIWNGIVSTIRGAFSKVKGIIDTVTGPARAIFGRGGGIAHRGGFRRYQHGGLVPAMVSPGEMIVHQGAAAMVPGQPVAADNVAMMLPVGAAVLTGDGQRMVSQGATVGQAIRRQAPHFAAGGWVRTGATVYNDPPPGAFGSLAGGYAELGTATRGGAGTGRGYIARALGMRGELPANYQLDVKIHGRTKTLRKRDRGYGQGTPAYSIDIWRDSWGAFGINSSFKGPALIRPHGGTAPAATGRAAGSSRTISGLAQAMARRVGRSPTRGGLVSDAWDQGFAQGQAGMTRSVLAREGDDAFRSIAAAYRLPAAKTITTPGRPGRPVVGGRPSSRDPGAPNYGGTSGPMVTFQGKRMRLWLAKALSYARSRGWRGYVVEGLRSIAEQRRLWNGAPGNGLIRGVSVAAPGTSNHQTGNAVDVSPAGSGLQRFFRGYRGHRPIWRGPTDRPHYSWNGHRAGGWIGGVRRFQTGGLAGRPASRPSYTFATPSDRGGVLRGDQYALYNQPQGGFGSALGGAMYAAESWARGSLAGLNKALQDAADSKIAALRKGVAAAVKRGGTEAAVKRLQAALSLIDKELARRAGLIQRRIDQRATRSDQFGRSVTAGLQMAGVDPSSSQGLLAQYRVQGANVASLQRTGGDLQKQLALALKAGDRTAAQTFRDAIAENTTQVTEGLGTLAQLARDGQAAQKAEQDALVTAVLEKRGAELQGAVDAAASGTSLAQAGLQRLGLEQQLAGTYDKGGQARGDYITQNIIPAIQAQITAMQAQQAEAQRLGATDTVRSLAEAIAGAQNDVLQAQLDAQEAIKQNTEDTVDSLKNLGGSLGFDFGGARFTDALVASGVGA